MTPNHARRHSQAGSTRNGPGSYARQQEPVATGMNRWQATVTVWAMAAVLAGLADIGPPFQPALVFSFALVCPGVAAASVIGFRDRLTWALLSVAISTILATIVAQGLLAAHWWSQTAWLIILALLTLLFVGVADMPVFVRMRGGREPSNVRVSR